MKKRAFGRLRNRACLVSASGTAGRRSSEAQPTIAPAVSASNAARTMRVAITRPELIAGKRSAVSISLDTRRARDSIRQASALDLHHDVLRLRVGVVEALLDEGVGLLPQGIEVELRRSRFSDQVAVQERDRDVAVSSALAHDVLAGVLLDAAVSGGLRNNRGRSDCGTKARHERPRCHA